MNKNRNIVSRIYYNCPDNIRNMFWKIYFLYIKLRALIKYRSIKYGSDLVYINPELVKRSLPKAGLGDKFRNIDAVEDGDWDIKGLMLFDNMESFVSLRDYFLNGVHISKSRYYINTLQSIQKGEILWGCKTKDELDMRCKRIVELYEDIKTNGYKTQKELCNAAYQDEITVNIGRCGELLFEDGQHRLTIAKILGLNNVPVLITRRHYQWHKFRNDILSYSDRNSGKIYQSIEHPDLKKIVSIYNDERWNIISSNLPFRTGTVLDIGAHWGFFSHKFEELGFDCTAIENNPTELYFLNRLNKIASKKIKIISTSIFDTAIEKYDIVLALNIFHHFLKTKRDYDKLTNFLRYIDVNIMFFQTHNVNEYQMENSYVNYNDVDFIRYILDNSCLNRYEYLDEDINKRKIYMLSK